MELLHNLVHLLLQSAAAVEDIALVVRAQMVVMVDRVAAERKL
jgi:hypothetical protein